mgnify:CR=1 FL=1
MCIRDSGTLDENSEFAFSDSVKWLCVKISDWISNEDLYGYVDRESELGIKIKNLLNDESIFIDLIKTPAKIKKGTDFRNVLFWYIRDISMKHYFEYVPKVVRDKKPKGFEVKMIRDYALKFVNLIVSQKDRYTLEFPLKEEDM